MAATENTLDFDIRLAKKKLHQRIDDNFVKLQLNLAYRFKAFEERFNCGRFKSEVRERAEEILKALNSGKHKTYSPVVQVPVTILPRSSFSPFFGDYDPIALSDVRLTTLIFKRAPISKEWFCTNLERMDNAAIKYSKYRFSKEFIDKEMERLML